ncbi:MAG: hypothetical protein ACSHX6_14600 [Akkermansiaceae bacterium]
MRNSQTLVILTAVVGLHGIANAQAVELPDKAKRVLDQLADYEERERKSAEVEILKKKQDVLKALERYEKRVENEGMLKLFGARIVKLKKEIADSERLISGVQVADIVDFDVVYHYKHPIADFSSQRGEMVFLKNGKVKVQHLDTTGKTTFENELSYKLVEEELKFSDLIFGDVTVSKNGGAGNKKINVEWARLNKTITAEAK